MGINIKVGAKWSIKSDNFSFKIVRHFKRKTKDGTYIDEEEIEGYYSHIDSLLKSFTNTLIRHSDATTLEEFGKDIKIAQLSIKRISNLITKGIENGKE